MKNHFRFKMEQFAEKIILAGLLKNAQMQVEPCEIPFAGAPEILCREGFETVPYRCTPQRLALLDKTLIDLTAFQEPQSLTPPSKS